MPSISPPHKKSSRHYNILGYDMATKQLFRVLILSSAVLLVLGGTALPPANPDGTCKVYTVQPGESLSTIADRHGFTLDVLKRCNPQIENYDSIYEGQLICLSAGTLPAPIVSPINRHGTCHVYTVKSPDQQGLTFGVPKPCNPQMDWFRPQLICWSATFMKSLPPNNFDGTCNVYNVKSDDSSSTIADEQGLTLDVPKPCNSDIDWFRPNQLICWSAMHMDALLPANPDGTCEFYTVLPGDSLSTIADKHGIPLDILKYCNPQIENYDSILPGQLICLSAGTPPAPQLPPANPDGTCKVYFVRPRDWLSTIAEQHGLSVDVLRRCNPHIRVEDYYLIYPGQSICLSAGRLPALPPANSDGTCKVYPVQPGDSLSTIADQQGIPLDVVKHCNPQIKNYDSILPGQMICLSGGYLPSSLPSRNGRARRSLASGGRSKRY
ncbi:hypothetical protein HK102_011619 [Quaeritorhiza haematococci]|nr:hypothetical protein HK102_011619 [Quaeritorhiza haematococci]